MKRNFWKIATASVGALALSIQSPAFASGNSDGTTFTGDVPEITLVSIDETTAVMDKVGNTLTKTLTGSLDYETNTTNKALAVSFGTENVLPSSDRAAAGVYDLTVRIYGGNGTADPADETHTWSSIDQGDSGTQQLVALTPGTDIHDANVVVTLKRHDELLLLKSSAYSMPITISVTSAV